MDGQLAMQSDEPRKLNLNSSKHIIQKGSLTASRVAEFLRLLNRFTRNHETNSRDLATLPSGSELRRGRNQIDEKNLGKNNVPLD